MKTSRFIFSSILVWMLTFGTFHSYAQFYNLDSLLEITHQPTCQDSNEAGCTTDTTRIDCYILVCRQYQHMGDYSTAMEYGVKALNQSEKINSGIRQADAHNRIAEIYRLQGDYQRALENHFIALTISDTVNYANGQARAAKNIGVLYYHLGDYNRALKSYYKSLEIYKSFGEGSLGVGHCLHNIGAINSLQRKYPEALQFFKEALVIKELMHDEVGRAAAGIRIGIIYREMAVQARQSGDPGKVIEFLNSSEEYLTSGLDMCIEIPYKKGEADAYNNLGELYFERNDYSMAISNLRRGLDVASRIGTKQYIRNSYRGLSKAFKELGKSEQALKHFESYITYRDSLVNEANNRAVIYHQTKYEFEKKELIKEQTEREFKRIEDEATARRDNLQYSVVLICLMVIGGFVSMLGRLALPARVTEGLIFFLFLIFFEFLLVLADPYIEQWSGGAPGIKLLFNAGIAAFIFPLHSFFENMIRSRISN